MSDLPVTSAQFAQLAARIDGIEAKLADAIKARDPEEIASLRAELKELREKLDKAKRSKRRGPKTTRAPAPPLVNDDDDDEDDDDEDDDEESDDFDDDY